MKTAAQPAKSKGHVEFIGGYEYFRLPDGNLLRAPTWRAVGKDGRRPGEFYADDDHAAFALESARFAAKPR
jgi:hypothetical protein